MISLWVAEEQNTFFQSKEDYIYHQIKFDEYSTILLTLEKAAEVGWTCYA